jgi:hypothetical protein
VTLTSNEAKSGRTWWRSAVKGGLIAAIAPIAVVFVLSFFWGSDDGIVMIGVAALVASPVLFGLGAAGGVIVRAVGGNDASASHERNERTDRIERVAWLVAVDWPASLRLGQPCLTGRSSEED